MRGQGVSVGRIALALGVSKSSVSNWVRGVVLSKEQRSALAKADAVGAKKGIRRHAENCRNARSEARARGRERARDKNHMHMMACALYWAEGTKSRSTVAFTNTDKNMMHFFICFLRQEFGISDDRFSVNVCCHTDNGLTAEEIQQYWLDVLALPQTCLRKPTLRHSNVGYAGTRHPYGVCRLRLNCVGIVQHIYGAIAEYFGTRDADICNE